MHGTVGYRKWTRNENTSLHSSNATHADLALVLVHRFLNWRWSRRRFRYSSRCRFVRNDDSRRLLLPLRQTHRKAFHKWLGAYLTAPWDMTFGSYLMEAPEAAWALNETWIIGRITRSHRRQRQILIGHVPGNCQDFTKGFGLCLPLPDVSPLNCSFWGSTRRWDLFLWSSAADRVSCTDWWRSNAAYLDWKTASLHCRLECGGRQPPWRSVSHIGSKPPAPSPQEGAHPNLSNIAQCGHQWTED